MKSAIYMGKEHIDIREVPIPTIGDHDVLIKNIYSSICGTDVAVYHHGANTGHQINIGEEFGHETVSRVAAVGKNITQFAVGDRVYPYPRFALGDTRRAGTIGGFSEYIRIPNAKLNHSLYKVDQSISDKAACLIEPFTVGCRAARRGQPKKGERFIVFGCGTIGLSCAIALNYFGIEQVMICDLSNVRLAIAKQLGFAICNIAEQDVQSKAIDYFGVADAMHGKVANIDCFIDAAGAQSILQLFMEQGKIESRLVAVAVNKAMREIDLLHLIYAQKSIIGSGGYAPEDVEDVMAIMKSGRWEIEQMITHEYPLSQLEHAIQMAGNSDQSFNVTIKFT